MQALALARTNERLVALNYAPRSWSKDAKLAFAHLPQELQAYYVTREKERDREVRRAQNDKAEALKKLALAEARIAELETLNTKGHENGTTETKQTAA